MTTIVQGWVEKFHGDQLVVALADLDILQRMLHELNVSWGGIDSRPALGLALMSGLNDGEVTRAAGALGEDPYVGSQLRAHRASREHAHRERCEVSDLALLIKGIQLRFADRYRGWELRIGKNYQPSMVKGYPHTGGGEGEPTPTREAFTTDAAEPMLTTPPGPHTGGEPDTTPGPHTGGGQPGSPPPGPLPPGTPPGAAPPDTDGAGAALIEAGSVPHDTQQPGRGVRVGLLDTRLFRHECLADHYVGRPVDLLPLDQQHFSEFDGHCAFVASCILQQAPHAQLYLQHVLDDRGDGSAWEAAVAIAAVADLGLDVVNLSFGEFMTDDNTAPMVLEAAVRRLGPETVVVAAAGNNGDADRLPAGLVPRGVTPSTKAYPAALPNVVGVGAIDQDGKLAPFTPQPAPWISLYARGVDLNGAYVHGEVTVPNKAGASRPTKQVSFSGTANWAGCSFAAGVVSGVIAAGVIPGRRSARDVLHALLA